MTLGVVGNDRVQIVRGLSAGQRVVLADRSAAVPSSTTTSRFGAGFGSGLGGGLTGGTGRFGGGFRTGG